VGEAPGLILDTSFLIDLEREIQRRLGAGPAQAFLLAHASEPFAITFTVAGELAAGMPVHGRAQWEVFISRFEVLPCTRDVCWEYAQTFRYLGDHGLLIGANDLWIAATALAFRRPLVTRNGREFRRVPRLEVIEHAISQ
jgi:predicted nucleic acid-binding protein